MSHELEELNCSPRLRICVGNAIRSKRGLYKNLNYNRDKKAKGEQQVPEITAKQARD